MWAFRSNTFILLEGSRNGDRLKENELLISPVLRTGSLGIRAIFPLKTIIYSLCLDRRVNKAKYH